jgi:hypothetical protein
MCAMHIKALLNAYPENKTSCVSQVYASIITIMDYNIVIPHFLILS